MAAAKTDILARFELVKSGPAIEAECPLSISPKDLLALNKGRVELPPDLSGGAFTAGTYSLVDSFSFDVQLMDKDSAEHKARMQQSLLKEHIGAEETKPGAEVPKGFDPNGQEFALWRNLSKPDEKKEQAALAGFSVKAGEFSISRRIDCASPKLFEMCCNQLRLNCVSILKRTMVPTGKPGEMESIAYLRLDFCDVLVVGVDWSDGDILEEKSKFQASTLAIRLMSQDSSGTLRACKPFSWKAKVADKALAARLG